VAAQLDICNIVTSEVDSIATQSMRAFIDTESDFGPDLIITVLQNGWVRYRFPTSPVLQIISAQYALAGSPTNPDWTTIPVAQAVTEHAAIIPTGTIIPSTPTGPNSILLPPGYVDWRNGRNGYRLQVSALCGFPVAGIDTPVTAGATAVHVDDIAGWWNGTAGARGTIYDPPYRELATVTGATPDTTGAITGPGTLTLAAGLQFPHTPTMDQANVANQKVLFSAMPNSLMQGALYLATHFGLIRGATASVMQTARGQVITTGMSGAQDWYDRAERIISRWGRNVL
jgi:hypothetical protein